LKAKPWLPFTCYICRGFEAFVDMTFVDFILYKEGFEPFGDMWCVERSQLRRGIW